MSETTLTISVTDMAQYRATARKRWATEQTALAERKKRAWVLAQQAATLLKTEFGATRVVLFGSLARSEDFTQWSDVDLAVWGLVPEDTLRAIGQVLEIDAEITLNLVDINVCVPALLAIIEIEGLEL